MICLQMVSERPSQHCEVEMRVQNNIAKIRFAILLTLFSLAGKASADYGDDLFFFIHVFSLGMMVYYLDNLERAIIFGDVVGFSNF